MEISRVLADIISAPLQLGHCVYLLIYTNATVESKVWSDGSQDVEGWWWAVYTCWLRRNCSLLLQGVCLHQTTCTPLFTMSFRQSSSTGFYRGLQFLRYNFMVVFANFWRRHSRPLKFNAWNDKPGLALREMYHSQWGKKVLAPIRR